MDLPLTFSSCSALNLELHEQLVIVSVADRSPRRIETTFERVSSHPLSSDQLSGQAGRLLPSVTSETRSIRMGARAGARMPSPSSSVNHDQRRSCPVLPAESCCEDRMPVSPEGCRSCVYIGIHCPKFSNLRWTGTVWPARCCGPPAAHRELNEGTSRDRRREFPSRITANNLLHVTMTSSDYL